VASVVIIVFAVYCLLYPFLVSGSEKRARLMNYIAFVLAFVVGLLVLEQSQTAFYYLIPVIAWTGYINFVDMIHINEHCMMDGVKIV
jgi:tryptophan-rich sensory protein